MIWVLLLATFVQTEQGLGIATSPLSEFPSKEVCEVARGNFIEQNKMNFQDFTAMVICAQKE